MQPAPSAAGSYVVYLELWRTLLVILMRLIFMSEWALFLFCPISTSCTVRHPYEPIAEANARLSKASLTTAECSVPRIRADASESDLCSAHSSGTMGRMLDLADYELIWPPELFVAEARRILARERVSTQAIDLLLREAFRDDSAAEDVTAPVPFGSWSSGAVARSASEMLAELAKSAHVIRRFSAPRLYWPQRLGRELPGPHLDAPGVRRGFADLVGELERTGYLDQAFPSPCVDDHYASEPDRAAELEKRFGIAGVWPLTPDEWDDSTFYGLIEVYHDLVSRPRERHYHDYSMCGWHYSHFSTTAGREVYRWKANETSQIGRNQLPARRQRRGPGSAGRSLR